MPTLSVSGFFSSPSPTGVKSGTRPGGTAATPAGQPGADGESVFSKILPGGAAEQAGKLTEGTCCGACLRPSPQGGLSRIPILVELGLGGIPGLPPSGPVATPCPRDCPCFHCPIGPAWEGASLIL